MARPTGRVGQGWCVSFVVLSTPPTETSAETARRAMRAVSCVSGHQPLLTCVASVWGVDYWRADYEDVAHQWEQVLGWPYSWILLSLLPARDRWHVPHFESRVSPRVQSYIISLFDYVIKTVSL